MSEDLLPQVGSRWRYGKHFNFREYWITHVGPEVIHLTDAKSGDQVPPYSTDEWEKAAREGIWQCVEESKAICPRCEEDLKMDEDYLCERCRYGE